MSLQNVYALNGVVRISGAFTVASVATDPTTVTLTIKDPSGTSTAYTYAGALVTKDSTGNYHKDVGVSSSGTWYYAWKGTGTVVAQVESKFFVSPTDV